MSLTSSSMLTSSFSVPSKSALPSTAGRAVGLRREEEVKRSGSAGLDGRKGRRPPSRNRFLVRSVVALASWLSSSTSPNASVISSFCCDCVEGGGLCGRGGGAVRNGRFERSGRRFLVRKPDKLLERSVVVAMRVSCSSTFTGPVVSLVASTASC